MTPLPHPGPGPAPLTCGVTACDLEAGETQKGLLAPLRPPPQQPRPVGVPSLPSTALDLTEAASTASSSSPSSRPSSISSITSALASATSSRRALLLVTLLTKGC